MTAASFRINQPPGSGYAFYDRSRQDLSLGTVELEAQNKSETSYLWEIISQAPGEDITITNPTSHTCQFDLATRYGYLVRLTVNAGELDESIQTRYIGVPLENSGGLLPALNETNQDNSQSPYNGERGTEHKLNDTLSRLDSGSLWQYQSNGDYIYPRTVTSRVHVANGSLASPALGFRNDVDTGIYLPSVGAMSFCGGGAEIFRAYIDSSDPVIEAQGVANLKVRNVGNPSGIEVATHVLSQTSNGDPNGAAVYVTGDAYDSTSAKTHVIAQTPGGVADAVLKASTVGVGGGTADILVSATGAGQNDVAIVSETTGAFSANVSVSGSSSGSTSDVSISATGNTGATGSLKSVSGAGNATLDLEADGTDAASYVSIGGDHCRVRFTDYLRVGSSYAASHLYVANAQSEWDNYSGRYGDVSLLNSIYQAGTQTLHSAWSNGDTITANGTPLTVEVDSGQSNDVVSIDQNSTGDGLAVSVANVNTSSWLSLYNGASLSMSIGMYSDDGIHIATGGNGDAHGSNTFIFTTESNKHKDHDRAANPTDPTLYLFSGTDVDSDNTKWMAFTRDSIGGKVITGGDGAFTIQANGGIVCYSAIIMSTEQTLSLASNTVTVAWSDKNFFDVSVDQNITSWSITNPSGPGNFQVRFVGTGSYTIDFPAAWKWDGAEPAFAIANGEERIVRVFYNGTYYYASMSGIYTT